MFAGSQQGGQQDPEDGAEVGRFSQCSIALRLFLIDPNSGLDELFED